MLNTTLSLISQYFYYFSDNNLYIGTLLPLSQFTLRLSKCTYKAKFCKVKIGYGVDIVFI